MLSLLLSSLSQERTRLLSRLHDAEAFATEIADDAEATRARARIQHLGQEKKR